MQFVSIEMDEHDISVPNCTFGLPHYPLPSSHKCIASYEISHVQKRVKSYLWMIQVMSVPTLLDAYFLYYTDGVSLYFASTSILFAILSDRGNSVSLNPFKETNIFSLS